MYIQKHRPSTSYQASNHMCMEKPHDMIQCRKCKNTPNAPAEYTGQTKLALRDRFGEHRRAIQNKTTDAVPQRFNQKRHKFTHIKLIPLELINSKRESILRARESFYIDTITIQPPGINGEDDYLLLIFFVHLFMFIIPFYP